VPSITRTFPGPVVTGGGKYVGGFGAQVQYADLDFPHHASRVRGFGAAFKAEVKRLQPALLQMGGFAKVIAQASNRVTVETSRPDRYGIPSPAIRFEFGDNDRAPLRGHDGSVCLQSTTGPASRCSSATTVSTASPATRRGLAGWVPTSDLGAGPVLPGARRGEPVRGRRQPVRHPAREESHAHDHGPGRADGPLHRGRPQASRPVTGPGGGFDE